MIYTANYSVNNVTRLECDLIDMYKRTITEKVCAMAENERYFHDECLWWVCDQNGKCVAAGGMDKNGKRYSIPSDCLYKYNRNSD